MKTPLPHDHGEHLEKMELPETGTFQAAAECFRNLDDGTRLKIFWLLCHCEECVINISAMMNMSSPAVSHHLRQLRDAGLVVTRRGGREVYYRAADTSTAKILHETIEKILEIACPK